MKLLLIGWDRADWSLIRQLLKRGLLPHFQQLLSNAITGEMQPVRPFKSASLWTTIVTGKRAFCHGVLGAMEVDSSQIRMRPTSRSALRAQPVWSILSDAGYRTHAFGWPASHPAEPINGVTVSDLFAEHGARNSVHPPLIRDGILELFQRPQDMDAAALLELLPRAGELNPRTDQRLHLVAQFLSSTASLHAAATWALEHEPWEFAAVRYAGLVRILHAFGAASAAAQASERCDHDDVFAELVPNAYHFFDMLLGRLVELAGPDASVMLISEQGSRPSPLPVKSSDRRRPAPGILLASGAGFKTERGLIEASVCDVTPTILHLFGLSTDPGSHGLAWRDVLRPAAPCASKPDFPRQHLRETDDAEPQPSDDDDSIEHLLALGYREQPDEYFQFAAAQLQQQLQWRLAEAWFDHRQYEPAARVLEELVRLEPTSIRYRSTLAEAYFRAGQYEACRRLIEALQADGMDTAMGQLGLAAVSLFPEKDEAQAAEHLQRAEALPEPSASVLDMAGQLYLRLRRSLDAARAFDAAILLDPTLGTAHEGRAVAALEAGDLPLAQRHARKAIELNPHSQEAHYRLGLALARQNHCDQAIEALRRAAGIDPRGGSKAHRQLAKMLEGRGETALAYHHRALADSRRV